MITIFYLVILISVLVLENILSEKFQYIGILLALGITFIGVNFCPKFIWIACIVLGVTVARLIIQEIRLLRLTSLKHRLANVVEMKARFN